jgi:hypothetical protein
MDPRVARVGNELVERPALDVIRRPFQRLSVSGHLTPDSLTPLSNFAGAPLSRRPGLRVDRILYSDPLGIMLRAAYPLAPGRA